MGPFVFLVEEAALQGRERSFFEMGFSPGALCYSFSIQESKLTTDQH